MKPIKSSLLMMGTVTLCFLVATIPAVSGRSSARKIKYCTLDMALECGIEPNTIFTSTQNGSGIVNSQDEMEQFCFNQVDYFPICMKQWLNRCANPVYQDLLPRIFVNPMGTAMKVFCDKDGPIRNEFLKYSNCLIHDVKLAKSYREKCIRPLQAASEFIHENARKNTSNFMDFGRATCCAYNKWENCILDHLTRKCGKPSADVFPYLIHQGSLDLLRYMCRPAAFDPENPAQCDKSKFVAPESYRPKGLTSHALISYIFSYSCPNVGWGIVPERDW